MEYTKSQLALTKFAGKTRPALRGLYLDNSIAVATDSIRLVEITNKDMVKFNGKNEPILVDAEYLKKYVKIPANQEYALISRDTMNGHANLESGNMSAKLPVISEDYPDYAKIKPTSEPKATIRVNATLLKEMLDVLEHIGSLKEVSIEIRGTNEPLVIKTTSQKEEALGLLMPLRQ